MTEQRRRLDALTDVVERISRSWKAVLVVALLFVIAFGLLMAAAAAFSEVSADLDPFDLQNRLTGDDIRAQLALYTDDSAVRYLGFAAVDLLFPLVGALLLATVTAACLRTAAPRFYERVVGSNLLLLFFVPTLLDWTENVFAIWLVVAGEPASSFAIGGLVVAKTLKLLTLTAAQLLTAAAVVAWLVTPPPTPPPTPHPLKAKLRSGT